MNHQLVLVEVVGPLVDDHGSISRTLASVLAGRGVVLRPGAVEQVAGTSAEWSLTTLLEGHGRDDLLPELGGMVASVHAGWHEAGARVTAASGAAVGWRRLSDRHSQVRAISACPTGIVSQYLERADQSNALMDLIDASGGTHGLPRPNAIRAAIEAAGCQPSDVMAIGSSGGMLLAAAGAGVADLVNIGESRDNLVATRWGATLQDV